MVRILISLLTTFFLINSIFLSNTLIAQSVAINEVMAANATGITDEDGDNEDWIELYNYGTQAVNLEGYGLSDKANIPYRWVFPSVTINPKSYLLVWASGKDRKLQTALHANFKIDVEGEDIILTAKDGTLVDAMASTYIPVDYSYGRYPNGTGDWFYYTATSPKAANSYNTAVLPPDPPIFSVSSGFYQNDFVLTLSHPNPEATIIYTLDGSQPREENLSGVEYNYKNQYPQDPGQAFGPLLTNTYTSNLYSTPLNINDRSPEPNKLANISSTWHYAPYYFPSGPIKKATVVRAVAIVDGISSSIKTNTYFVSESSNFNSALPIASISLNEDGLFDYDNGIYVAGRDFDKWREDSRNGVTTGHVPANYRRRGEGTEQFASFQYFVDGEEVLNQNIGLRLHGSFSRATQNKTFRLYARLQYDTQNSFDYPFFGEGNSKSFKRLLFRNSGNDAGDLWIGGATIPTISPAVYFRDALVHKMASHMGFDIQDYTPVITYVNGEYWGMLNARERYDKHYMKRKYGINLADLELLEANASVVEGSNSHYLMMRNYISSNNLALTEVYEKVKTYMDVENFRDYQITEIFAANGDWPGNNIKYYRKKTLQYEPDAPYAQDGRWRWLMFDTDHGFGWRGGNHYADNTLNNVSNSSNWDKVILTRLLNNTEFKNSFINRYADILNSAFSTERLTSLIREMAERIADEIPLHQDRWNTLPDWENNVDLMCEFAEKRPGYARTHITGRFQLRGTYNVTLDVSDNEHGYIKLNTIDVNGTTPGISESPYPWSGIYFQRIPISVTAVPKPGYIFSHWSGTHSSEELELLITPEINLSLKANFIVSDEGASDIMYFWTMNKKIANDTPLQKLWSTFSISGQPASIDFFSSYGPDYPYEPSHPNWRKGSMERKNSPTAINYYPEVNSNIKFESSDMRGLQIKEPFLNNVYENTLIFNVPTKDYENIRLSFAAKDEGAANKLIVDYFDSQSATWINTGLLNSSAMLSSEYQLYIFDFGQINEADNNPEFKIRLRFVGTDMTKDNDNEVVFNNIAVKGTALIPVNINKSKVLKENLVSVYPNPVSNQLTIHSDPFMEGCDFKLFDMFGNNVLNGNLNYITTILNMTSYPSGTYLLKIEHNSSQFIKILKN